MPGRARRKGRNEPRPWFRAGRKTRRGRPGGRGADYNKFYLMIDTSENQDIMKFAIKTLEAAHARDRRGRPRRDDVGRPCFDRAKAMFSPRLVSDPEGNILLNR